MKRKIIIEGKPFEYEAEFLSDDTNAPMSLETAIELLTKVKESFDCIQLPFYLCYGTLLGAIRERTLIQGDEDLDVFITDETKLYKNLPFLRGFGLELIRLVPNIVYSFKTSGQGYVDVYILSKLKWYNPWSSYCYALESKIQPKKFFYGFEEITFLGVQCLCPKNPEKILEFWYGKSWRTPIRGHKFYYEVKTAYYWHWIRDNIIKKIILYDRWCEYIKKQ